MPLSMLFSYVFLFSIFSSIRMRKRQKLSSTVYRKLKATREREDRKYAAAFICFL